MTNDGERPAETDRGSEGGTDTLVVELAAGERDARHWHVGPRVGVGTRSHDHG